MKRLAGLFLVLTLGLSGAGCAQFNALTTSIANPIGPVDIYRVKNTYAAALQIVVDYRNYCWSKPYAALMADPVSKPICQNRRAAVRYAQVAHTRARTAIDAADAFVANNPRLSAASVINAAWQAVTAFQSSIPALAR